MKVIKQSATIPYSHMYDFPVGQNLLVTKEMRDLWSKVENDLHEYVFRRDNPITQCVEIEVRFVAESLAEVCHWDETHDGDFKEWATDCDHVLPDSSFNPEELEIEYCPKCGRRVVVRHD